VVADTIRIPCGVAVSLAGRRSFTGGGTTPGPSRLRLLPSLHPRGPQDNRLWRRVRERVLLVEMCPKPPIHAHYSASEAPQVEFERLNIGHRFSYPLSLVMPLTGHEQAVGS